MVHMQREGLNLSPDPSTTAPVWINFPENGPEEIDTFYVPLQTEI
jgi:hypothetical protein